MNRTATAKHEGLMQIWAMAGMTALCGIGVAGMLALLVAGSLPYFWPEDLVTFNVQEDPLDEAEAIAGKIVSRQTFTADYLRAAGEDIPSDAGEVTRYYIKTGNRDIAGLDFTSLLSLHLPGPPVKSKDIGVLERRRWGDFYGYATALRAGDEVLAEGDDTWNRVRSTLVEAHRLYGDARALETGRIADINRQLEQLNLRIRRTDSSAQGQLLQQKSLLQEEYLKAELALDEARAASRRFSVLMRDAGGEEREVNLADIVRMYQPNRLGFFAKMEIFFSKMAEFLTDEPRESNTEGGVFPAIFGTVSMVLFMSVLVTPFGVLAAFYLHEYRRQGLFVRIIRICISNLAGVPSIVFGIFGLGFFVYSLGGSLDDLFFSDRLPNPTLGTPGLFWASLTMALLTLPVVVVSTEEGLSRVPSSIREGALALGATRMEMLYRTVFPMALPGILTGLILAIARAAGEVAPLMLVGAVKFAPDLPVDGHFPYIHPEQKFMHLGLHIYDAGFQSPNSEAALPLVYASSLLLVVIILVLNLGAMWLRNHYRERIRALQI